jgi:hypothetical protein
MRNIIITSLISLVGGTIGLITSIWLCEIFHWISGAGGPGGAFLGIIFLGSIGFIVGAGISGVTWSFIKIKVAAKRKQMFLILATVVIIFLNYGNGFYDSYTFYYAIFGTILIIVPVLNEYRWVPQIIAAYSIVIAFLSCFDIYGFVYLISIKTAVSTSYGHTYDAQPFITLIIKAILSIASCITIFLVRNRMNGGYSTLKKDSFAI